MAQTLTKEWIEKYGVPERIHSDRGRDFEGKIIQGLCNIYGMKKSRTMAYHPAGNGQCERYNRTMIDLLQSLSEEQRKKWPQYLPALVQAYNATPHASTGFAPHFLLFGQDPRLPVDIFLGRPASSTTVTTDWIRHHRQRLLEAHTKAQQRLTAAAERRSASTPAKPDHTLNVGDLIYIRTRVPNSKLSNLWLSDLFEVTKQCFHDDLVYVVQPYGAARNWFRTGLTYCWREI